MKPQYCRRMDRPWGGLSRLLCSTSTLILACLAALAIASAPQPGSAQDALGDGNDLFPEFSSGGGEQARTQPSSWSARYGPADGSDQVQLQVDVELGSGWHLYSLTQPTGGPKPTRLTVIEPTGAEVAESWSPNEPPKKSVSEDFGGLTLEEHDDEVRFTSTVQLPPGYDGPVHVRVDAQVCQDDGSCIPVRETLVAERSGGDNKAAETATEAEPSSEASAQASQGSESEAVGDPFRDGDYVVEWKASLSASRAEPGSQLTLKVTANPDPTYHVYTAAVDDSSSSTNFVIRDKGGLRIGAPMTNEPIVDSDQLPGTSYHEGDVTWSLPVEVPEDLEPGEQTIEGFIVYQACTETSCQRPMALAFEAELTVTEELAEPASALPIQLVSAKRAEALDLAATQRWVDELSATTPAPGGASGAAGEPAGDEATSRDDDAAAAPVSAPGDTGLMPFPLILLFAFLGGIILNVMPCVLPIVGLKVMGFVKQAGEDRGRILTLNLAYIGGILTMFALFAILAVSVSFGWGEQLTYFPVRLGLTLLLFALALSYFGVWEIPVPGFAAGKASQELQQREGMTGAYSKGIFATILATPCSGPLLGYILGLTLALSAPLTFLIFMTVGLGMSLPYLVVGLRPGLIGWLPQPGPWMETLKQFLAFLFLATVAFFFATFSDHHKVPVFIALLGVWFGCWLIGQVPNWERLSKRLAAWTAGIAFATLIGVGAFRLIGQEKLLEWEPYSEARLVQLQNQGRTVLLDFGAKWCGNCIYNYETALDTEPTRELVEQLDAVAMYADWTDSDPEIEAKLKELDSISIPLLVIYPGNDPDNPLVLRDIVTQGQVLAALEQAGPSQAGPDAESPSMLTQRAKAESLVTTSD